MPTTYNFAPGDLYQQSKHTETMERLNATRLFTASNISFKPSNSTDTCSTLNVTLDFMFDRPYDFYVEAYGRGKTTGKYGPELVVGVTKRNAFRGAELLNVRFARCIRVDNKNAATMLAPPDALTITSTEQR